MERYEEEYCAFWKICLKAVAAPFDEVQLGYDLERIKRDAEKEQQLLKDDPFWLFRKINARRSFSVVADHRDILKLRGEQEYIRMHPSRWLWTMDAILAEYWYLSEKNTRYQIVQIPDEIVVARNRYINNIKADRKQMRLPIDLLKPLVRGRAAYGKCRLAQNTASAQLNLLCHDLITHGGSTDIKADIHYDGLKFTLPKLENDEFFYTNSGDFIPDFKLSDFIYHELATGLSLSIEITAVLMELSPEIRDMALDAFIKKGLAEIARSPYIYTRIAAARSFFNQIHMEWMKFNHSWSSAKETLTEEDTKHWSPQSMWEDFEDSIDYAHTHLMILNLGKERDYLDSSDIEIYPEDRILVDSERDKEVLYRTDQLRDAQGESVAPWLVVQNQEEMELYIHRRPFSFQKVAVPTDEVELEKLMRYYEGLMGQVEYPLNTGSWEDSPPENLAVFVQSKHKYVPILLDYLNNGDMRKGWVKEVCKQTGENPEVFSDACSTCIEFYKKVHSRVQAACIAAFVK